MEFYKNLSLENLTTTFKGVFYIEKWKDIPDYENLYQASTFGRIKLLGRTQSNLLTKGISIHPPKIMKQNLRKSGYLAITLTKNNKPRTFRSNRIIAITFIENTFNRPEVNHIDTKKWNNFYLNLEWHTQKQNRQHAIENGLIDIEKMTTYLKHFYGAEHHGARAIVQLDLNNNFVAEFDCMVRAAKLFNRKQGKIGMVCAGKRKVAFGYKWMYKEDYEKSLIELRLNLPVQNIRTAPDVVGNT